MQNKKTKNALRAVAFVLILVLIITGLSGIFSAKWYDKNSETAMAKHVYQLKKDSVEVLLLGSSQVTWSIDSVEFYKKYGILTYAIGGSHNNLLMNYYWLLDTLQRQKNIKTVMVDTSLVFNSDEDDSFDYMKNLQGMRWSKYKYEAIRDYYNKIETPETEENSFFDILNNYIFTLNQYHSRWDELDEVDFDDESYDIHNVMGFTPTANVWEANIAFEDFVTDNDAQDKMDIYNPVQEEYLRKIIDTCREREIQVVLMKTPKDSWPKTGSDYIRRLAQEKDVAFLDCTTAAALNETGIDYYRDFKDRDHLNIRGARKLADYLCSYLLANGSYTDYRKQNGISKKELEIYNKKADECILNSTVSIPEYFSELRKRDYTVILQSSADIADYWTEDLQEELQSLGFTLDIAQQKGKNYITAVKNGKVVLETADKGAQEDSLNVVPSIKVKLVSKFGDATTKPGREKALSFSQNGLRISVFDKDTGAVVSRATLYNAGGTLALAVEKTY